MNIYFACSITGGREFEKTYQLLTQTLEADGHTVPTSHLASSEILDMEKIHSAVDVFTRDIQWIDEAQALIAEVSTPSHGVGYEIAYALETGKPVLCLYRHDQKVSKMLTGNTHRNIQTHAYQTNQDAVNIMRGFIAFVNNVTK